MDDLDAIRRTIALYCQLCDDGRFEEWGDLYTEDARFCVLGKVYEGREEIRGFIERAQPAGARGKHVAANPVIDVEGDEAVARTDYVFLSRNGGSLALTSAGRYHDRLVRRGGRWLFSERRIVFLGDEPG
jgi:uncharacterized protein (TIGR02246 family)